MIRLEALGQQAEARLGGWRPSIELVRRTYKDTLPREDMSAPLTDDPGNGATGSGSSPSDPLPLLTSHIEGGLAAAAALTFFQG